MANLVPVLFYSCFALVVVAAATGLMKFAFKDNEILVMLHKMVGYIANFAYIALFLILMYAMDNRPLQRMIFTGLFVLLVYTGLVTGPKKDNAIMQIAHKVLGVFTLAGFTVLMVIRVVLG